VTVLKPLQVIEEFCFGGADDTFPPENVEAIRMAPKGNKPAFCEVPVFIPAQHGSRAAVLHIAVHVMPYDIDCGLVPIRMENREGIGDKRGIPVIKGDG